MKGTSLIQILGVVYISLAASTCARSPSQPSASTLPAGRWTGDGACLSVAADECEFVAGCGHGQFPAPAVRGDGTFQINGTYRIEVGPISIDPPPSAVFSGALRSGALTLTVSPSDPALRPASYALQLTGSSARCTVPCL